MSYLWLYRDISGEVIWVYSHPPFMAEDGRWNKLVNIGGLATGLTIEDATILKWATNYLACAKAWRIRMDNITNIDDFRPHAGGPAKCMNCKHEWEAITLKSKIHELECPECLHLTGEMIGQFIPSTLFQCGCGCELFYLTANGYMCPVCGDEKTAKELHNG